MSFNEPEKRKITVLRGIAMNGDRVGPISGEVKVYYRLIAGTAKPGVDYVSSNGEIIFKNGITEAYFEIEVLSDPTPELHETFSVELYRTTPGIILSEQTTLQITITKNDDPHGVISFAKQDMNHYVIDEDGTGSVSITVNRSMGTFGNTTVTWELKSGLSNAVVHNVSGTIQFLSGEASKEIFLSTISNNVPSEALQFDLQLTNVTGGARIMLMADGKYANVNVVVADSDNAYGTVSFAAENSKIILVSKFKFVSSLL